MTSFPLLLTSHRSRGVKAEFKNPLHDPDHPDGVPPPGPSDPSTLPVDDLEFSPTPYCPPKLLFPEARKHDHARLRKRKANGHASGSGNNSTAELSDEPVKKRVAPAPTPSTPERPSTPNGKGKSRSRSHSAPKSEWDTSDEEEEPQPVRRGRKHRHEVAGVKPRFPVEVLPVHEEVADKEEEKEVEEQIKQMPKQDVRRLKKIAPLLLDAPAGER